jgi:hypothetical protein
MIKKFSENITGFSYAIIGLSAFSAIWSIIYPFLFKFIIGLKIDGKSIDQTFDTMPPMLAFLFKNIDFVATAQFLISIGALIGAVGMLKRYKWGLITVSSVFMIASFFSFIFSFYLYDDLNIKGFPYIVVIVSVVYSYIISCAIAAIGLILYIPAIRRQFH